MTEPIARAAKALQESKAWPAVFYAGKADDLARIALYAVHEPSDKMIAAGGRALFGAAGNSYAAAVWRAMHEAMMRE
jgi:hypothetical protein